MADLKKLGELVERLKREVAGSKLRTYQPYQWQKEFHDAGAHHAERMLMAANRVGKTMSAACEVAYHMTGDYPDWWGGKRFSQPVLVWTGSPTNETSSDIVQEALLGGLGEKLGTGWIPRSRLVGTPTTRQAGVKNVVDSFNVRHSSGGVSTVKLKTYEQGWQKWQGTAPHVVWDDEEPDDMMIYTESMTRILSSGGILIVTFTPLRGRTKLVQYFMERRIGTYLRSATWDDAPHLDVQAKAELIQRYPSESERDARTRGVPMLGEGAIFPVRDEMIRVDPFRIPDHFARIKGLDFGISHPQAGVDNAWDRDQDIWYVIDCYKKAGEIAPYHAAWLNKGDRRIPVAWPHDGMNREKKGGGTLAKAYEELGVNMLPKSARYPRAIGDQHDKAGPQPVEPIVDEALQRMMTGRLKVFSHLTPWFDEKNSYHRDNGVIVATNDDILKAMFYAMMMKRYAVAPDSFASRISTAPPRSIASARVA